MISFQERVGYEIENADAKEELRCREVVRRLEAGDLLRRVTYEEGGSRGWLGSRRTARSS